MPLILKLTAQILTLTQLGGTNGGQASGPRLRMSVGDPGAHAEATAFTTLVVEFPKSAMAALTKDFDIFHLGSMLI